MSKVEVITKMFDTDPPLILKQEVDRQILAKNLVYMASVAKKRGLRPGEDDINKSIKLKLSPGAYYIGSADKLAVILTALIAEATDRRNQK